MQEQLSLDIGLRVCTQCKQPKPLEAFGKRARSRDGYMEACKECRRLWRERDKEKIQDRGRRYYAENRERIRDFQRRNHRNTHLARYRITVDDWEKMFDEQGRICPICLDPDPPRGWHTDHCHETLKVRGILCFRCNVALGHLQDSVASLERAREYLLRHQP